MGKMKLCERRRRERGGVGRRREGEGVCEGGEILKTYKIIPPKLFPKQKRFNKKRNQKTKRKEKIWKGRRQFCFSFFGKGR